MATMKIEKIGLIAHYSPQGDWAFALAFELTRRGNFQLNIFHFLETTYDIPFDAELKRHPPGEENEKLLIAEERKLREHYDRYLEDYENVGFRLCTRERHNYDLRSCMRKKDFQLLIIPYINSDMKMDDMSIEQFAYIFAAPVILVGPNLENEYHLNSPAGLLAETNDVLVKFRDKSLYEEIHQGHG